ncbi:MAG: LanC-like protein [Solirubrobacterales bacterium]|nr:LanC-like protein [Solirubrobacterales bacterium]
MIWRPSEHEQVTARPWDERLARKAIEAIVADAEAAQVDGFWPGHPLDDAAEHDRFSSLYLGSAGMIWGLWRLGAAPDASAALETAIDPYRVTPDFGPAAHPPSLWMGETGLLLVADKVRSPLADRQRLRDLVHRNREHQTWELMWGSPGTMLAARACELPEAWEESARLLWARWDEASDLWTQDMYGQVTQYLGPAHGFAGNAHALRGVDDDLLRARVTRLLERTALAQDGMFNWPPTPGAPMEKIRVQWCHGAPGIVSTLGDLIPEAMLLGAAELIWRAGPLRKGPGLCHGTAGNGFALLKVHELTGDDCWLDRARRFAMHAIQQVERQRAEAGRGRYTLWTGDLGVALYLRACLDARSAFPTIDAF